jgi:F0F1-type ATP synthase delta subunit
MKTLRIVTPLTLTSSQLNSLKIACNLSPSDTVIQKVDPEIIAGLRVDIDGATVDMTIKHQLAQIARGS